MKAVLLCAGMGTRLRPLSFIRPKPLLVINGQSLLERTISLLQQDGITDITVITGYKNELIEKEVAKYNVTCIHSDRYNLANNHSSLQLVKDKLDDCLIIDGDLYLLHGVKSLIVPGRSQFIAQQTTHGTEWELFTDEANRIASVIKDSPSGYGMSGCSYWVGEGAALLAKELETCTTEEFWEDAAIRVSRKTPVYATKVDPFQKEIDSLYDAVALGLTTPEELADQCSLVPAKKLKGLTNSTFLVNYGSGNRVLRIPGLGTELFIDRSAEEYIISIMGKSGVTPDTEFYANALKTTEYLDGYEVLAQKHMTPHTFTMLSNQLRTLHSYKLLDYSNRYAFSIYNEIDNYEQKTGISLVTPQERELLRHIAKELDADEQVLCHRDLLLDNIMIKEDDLKIIDFEYSAFSSAYWDIACFVVEAKLQGDMRASFLESYGNLDDIRVLKAEVIVDYIWGLWGWLNHCIDYGRARMVNFHNNLEKLRHQGIL